MGSGLIPDRVDLGQHPDHLAPGVRVDRQHVDHVGPSVAVDISVAQELGGYPISVGLVEDQDESFTATLYPA